VRLGVAIVALATAAACGGQSCSCLSPIPGGFDPSKRAPNAIQARVGMKGISFLESHVSDLVNAFVPGGLNQAISPSCSGNPKLCCESPDPMCRANVTVTSMSLNPTPPKDVDFTIRAVVQTSSHGNPPPSSIPFTYNILFDLSCDLEINTRASGAPDLGIVGAFTLNAPADQVTDLTSVTVNVSDIIDLDNGDITISGNVGCFIADLLKGLFIGTLKTQLISQVQSAINNQLCQSCQTVADCAPFGDACTNGRCMRGSACIQHLGVEGRMDAGSLVAKFSPGLKSYLDMYMVAGGYADTQNAGISLGLLGGLEPQTRNSCVPMADPPAPVAIPMSATFDGNVNPNNNQPFDVGIGIHKWFLEHGGWAAWQGGVLCLNIGSGSVDLLNSGTFSLLAPSMDALTHGTTAPMFITMRPQQAPQMTLGAGTFTVDAMGNKVIQDPLLTITLPQLLMEFYLMSDDRYIRVFSLTSDVSLPLALDVDSNGKLVPILGDLGTAFKNIQVSNSSLLSETPANLAMQFPTVLSVALPFIAKSLPAIALPSVMGINLKVAPGGITSTDNNTMLAIFTDLMIGMPAQSTVRTTAEVTKIDLPSTEQFHITSNFDYHTQTPGLHLKVGGDRQNLEWQYRIDEGFWSPFQALAETVIHDPILMWQGHHTIDVRARVVGASETLDRDPVSIPILIDTVAPQASLDLAGTVAQITAHDLVTKDDLLRYEASKDGGTTWTAMAGPTLDVGHHPEGYLFRVTDEAGNSAVIQWHGRETTTGSGCNCSVSGRDETGGSVLVLLGIVSIVLVARRKRVLAVALAALLGGCGDDIGNNMGGPDAGPKTAVQGGTGRWSDLGAKNGKVVVSGYEEHYGDLLLGTVDTSSNKVHYAIVDGVPNVPPTLDPTGYRGGIVDSGDDVGLYTSLAMDSTGRVYISYFDATNGALKLAYGTDTTDVTAWKIMTVDTPPTGTSPATPDQPGVRVGIYTSLTLDKNGNPTIAYMAHGLPDGMNSFTSELRYAKASSATPSQASDFTVTKVDSLPTGCKGLCDSHSVCNAMSKKCQPTVMGCMPDCSATQGCVMGASGPACVDIIAAPKSYDLPEGVGLFASLARLSTDAPIIIYHDRTNGNLKGAIYAASSSTWSLSVLDGADSAGMDTGDVGQWCSVAVAAGDVVHIAYQDSLADSLRYMQVMGTTTIKELVDDGMRMDGPHSVGDDTRIALDASGTPRIVYQDGRAVVMQMAQRMGTNMWVRMDVPAPMNGTNRGFFPRLALDGSTLWGSDFFYDRAVKPFGQIEVQRLP
jgi:hypothetical protein